MPLAFERARRHKLEFIGEFLCSFLFCVEKKRTKETPLGDGEVSIKQKQSRIKNDQTVRLLLDFNISPSPKTPPPLRAHPLGSHERGFVNRLKEILSPALRTVAVISFEMKLKS